MKKRVLQFVILLIISLIVGFGFYHKDHKTTQHVKLTSQVNTPISKLITGTPSESKPVVTPTDINTAQVLDLVDQARENQGLRELTNNTYLDTAAQVKCQDMVTYNYAAHTSPSGQSFEVDINNALPPHSDNIYIGQNLAEDFDSAQAVFNAWMASPEHKANILNVYFTESGIAVCKSNDFLDNGPELLIVEDFAQL